MIKMWEEEFEVQTFDADHSGKLKIARLLNYFQEAASNHAATLGFGYYDLEESGVYWVLNGLYIEIENLPEFTEKFKLKTWPKGIHKLFALRDFILVDSHDQEIVKATSSWLVIDKISHRPRRIEQLERPIPLMGDLGDATKVIPQKLQFESPLSEIIRLTSRYSDLDINSHVNNVRYMEWAMDAYYTKNSIISFPIKAELNFLSETRSNTPILVSGKGNEVEFQSEITSILDNKLIFKLLLKK